MPPATAPAQTDLFERLLISSCEKRLRKYREAETRLRVEFLNEYRSFLPEIERCYARAGYWHGTGRFHHHHAKDSRYEAYDAKRTVDVFQSILRAGELAKHTDMWVKFDGKFRQTVSIAPSRMHARLYAHMHLREGLWLEYIFGGTHLWMGFFVLLASWQLLVKPDRKGWGNVQWTFINKDLFKQLRTWAGAVCNTDKYTILPIWRPYDLRSDIAENYGILFGIKREAVRSDGVLPPIKRFEVRIDHTIKLGDMTHVEVPLENVAETKRVLAAHNVSLPVIPLEFGELFCSQFPLRQLANA